MRHMNTANGTAAMSFPEIDHRMGWNQGSAHSCFMNAMKKLRREHASLRKLAELVAFRERECTYGEPVIAPNPKYTPRLRDVASLETFTEMEERA